MTPKESAESASFCVIKPNYRNDSALRKDSGPCRPRQRSHGRRVHLAQQGRFSELDDTDDRPEPITDHSSLRQQGPGVRRVQGDLRRSSSSKPVTDCPVSDWRLSAE
jgi:hypothetical protein